MSIENFSLDVQKWAEKANGRLTAFVTEFIQDLNAELIAATPVDTGFLRGSWFASIGAPQFGGGSIDKSGAGVVAQLNLVAAGMQIGQVYYAMNGAVYARAVEYGTIHMAPRAYVRGTLARAQAIADVAAARVAAL